LRLAVGFSVSFMTAKVTVMCDFCYKREEKLMFFHKIGMILENLKYFCIVFQLKASVWAMNEPNVID